MGPIVFWGPLKRPWAAFLAQLKCNCLNPDGWPVCVRRTGRLVRIS